MSLKCPECGSDMILKNSKYGKFYGCSSFPLCKATHGAHPNGEPLGFSANKELKLLRIKAHQELEKYFGRWKDMSRKDKAKMYKWLKNNTKSGHIGNMGKEDIAILFKKLKEIDKAL